MNTENEEQIRNILNGDSDNNNEQGLFITGMMHNFSLYLGGHIMHIYRSPFLIWGSSRISLHDLQVTIIIIIILLILTLNAAPQFNLCLKAALSIGPSLQ